MTPYRFARRAEFAGTSVYDHAEGAIILSVGSAYPPILPDLSREAAEAAAEFKPETMQYGPLMGLDDLRDAIVGHVSTDGVNCRRENVLVTNGAKHATDLACRVFLEAGDRIIVTAPTYMTTLQCMRTHGANFLSIPQDDEGIKTTVLENRLATLKANGEAMPKLLFDVPDFHNPTGITTTLERRLELIELARKYGFVIIEDDPYRRVRFEGTPVPPLKSLDKDGLVIAVGTVSKVLAPGLRIGWALADPEIVRRMALQKSDGGSSPFTQRIVERALRSNKLQNHIDLVTQHMREHRDVMVAALTEDLPEVTYRCPNGGYFLWLELPVGVSGDEIARRAIDHGVEVASGRLCYPDEDPGHHLRLSFSYNSPEKIREGVRRLARAYHDVTGTRHKP